MVCETETRKGRSNGAKNSARLTPRARANRLTTSTVGDRFQFQPSQPVVDLTPARAIRFQRLDAKRRLTAATE